MLTMNMRFVLAASGLALALLAPNTPHAQTTYAEDFTKGATVNKWYTFGGACLTAGAAGVTSAGSTSAGPIPACLQLPYFTGLGDNTTATGVYGGTTGTLPDVSG